VKRMRRCRIVPRRDSLHALRALHKPSDRSS
jgi:hypothetical protein